MEGMRRRLSGRGTKLMEIQGSTKRPKSEKLSEQLALGLGVDRIVRAGLSNHGKG